MLNRWMIGLPLIFVLVNCGNGDQNSESRLNLPGQTVGDRAAALDGLAARLPDDAASVEHQVFRYLAAEPKSMDMNTRLYGAGGSEFLFERLCMFGLDGELLPGAAERWVSSDDGKTWTFYLRPEALWSDGRPVTAHDFEYTFKRFLHPDAGNVYAFLYYDIKGAKAYNQRDITDVNQVGVRAVDDHTFV
ncbi:MAG: ABC transporter substrate-binding protein, partial [Gammaproteobacteria bacterium]|nr:ABC transporter substrate-binding protein [Gammaproteobacteria bacterium]